jgi:hypothetical protein
MTAIAVVRCARRSGRRRRGRRGRRQRVHGGGVLELRERRAPLFDGCACFGRQGRERAMIACGRLGLRGPRHERRHEGCRVEVGGGGGQQTRRQVQCRRRRGGGGGRGKRVGLEVPRPVLARQPRIGDNARECVDLLIVCRRGMTRVVVKLERRRGLGMRRVGVKARLRANTAAAAAAATKGARKRGVGGGRLDTFGLGLWVDGVLKSERVGSARKCPTWRKGKSGLTWFMV